MAGPVPSYLSTQTAAQAAFTVPFGLLSFVNAAIASATAAGEFNVTVDCSLFVTEDVSNLRIYLDSLGYSVEFAKNSNDKSLNIDWGRFLDIPGTEVVVDQGTTPWIVAGTVTANQGTSPWVVTGTISTSPDVNVHDGVGNPIGSVGGSLDANVTNFPASFGVMQDTSPWVIDGSVSVTNFPAVQPVSGTVTALQGTSPWTVDGTVNVGNFPASQDVVVTNAPTVNQGTSPWIVSGSVVTSPDVNIHDSSGNPLSSTGTSLDVDVTNTVTVTGPLTDAQLRATPVPISGTVTANAGSGNFTVVQPSGASLHVDVDNFPATQPVSGTVTANQGTSPWVVSGTVTANAGTGTFLVDGSAHTQPVSGTVTANAGTGTFLVDGSAYTQPVSGTVTANAGTGNFTVVQPTGTNLHTVLDSGTLTSITNALPAGTNVIGHVITDTGSTTVVTGNVTVVQPTGTNLHTVVDSGSITVNNGSGASAVNIQDGGNSITVDGTITANQGTANTIGNAWPVKITDGTTTVAVNTDNSLPVEGKYADGTTATPKPIAIGGPDDSGVIQTVDNDLILGEQSLYVNASPINADLVKDNKLYSVGLDVVAATSGVDNPLVYIRNPVASGVVISVVKLHVGTTVTNVGVEFKLTADPTVTVNGTAQTAISRNIGGGAAAAKGLVTTIPTVTAIGGVMSNAQTGQNSNSFSMDEDYAIIIQPGHAMLVTGSPSSNNRNCDVTLVWAEV